MQLQAAIEQRKFYDAAKQQCLDDIAELDVEIKANDGLQEQINGQMNAAGCTNPGT